MGIIDRFRKRDCVDEIHHEKLEKKNSNDVITMTNYMLSDIKKDDISKDSYQLSLDELSEISPLAINTVSMIKKITGQNSKSSGNLYRIINLGENDSLKAMRDGKTFWGAIKKSDGTSSIAKLKEVNLSSAMTLEPTVMMMSFALASIEAELGEIKEISKKIFSFLENEKEAQIEADLETLRKAANEMKYNLENEKYISNSLNQAMDIERTARSNMKHYEKQIKDILLKNKLFTTGNSMNAILDEMVKNFKYYRLSLYTYSFSTYIEIFLNGNYKSNYLLSKIEELNELNQDYMDTFHKAIKYVQQNANKSLEGNVLSGLGTAGKTIGNLASKMKAKNVDHWLNEKGDNLKQSSQNFIHNYVNKFEEMKETNSHIFVHQIEKINNIYNNTTEIYFDENHIYLQMH